MTEFIRKHCLEFTGPEIQHNIEKLGVWVNDSLIFNRQEWLFGTPQISIQHWPERLKGNFEQVKILLETESLMLVFKPTGTVCQAGNGHLLDNLEFFLNQRAENLDTVRDLQMSCQNDRSVNSENTNGLKNSQYLNLNQLETKTDVAISSEANLTKSTSANSETQSNLSSKLTVNQLFLKGFAQGSEKLEPNLENPSNFKISNSNQNWLAAHRLDKDTQGLLLLAKGEANLDKLQNQFRARLVVKKYLAVVEGLVDQVWHVNNWQARDARSPVSQKFFWSQKEAKEYDALAKNAQSIIIPQVVCPSTGQSLIQIQILTGRMHQIRLQCQHLAFPLTKDSIYQTKVGLDDCWYNPKSLLRSPYWMSNLDDFDQSLQLKRQTSQLKHNFNSPRSDSTNSKQKKVSPQVLAKIAQKNWSQAAFHNFDNVLDEFSSSKIQQDGFYRFYGNKPVKVMEEFAFEKLRTEIFGTTDYCLLANFLALQTPKFFLESQFVDLENLIN